MVSVYTCSFIIPYIHTPKNFLLLQKNLNNLFKNPAIQVIVVETGKVPRANYQDIPATYVFVESDIYNLGWLYNVGARYAHTNNLFFGDNSYISGAEIVQAVLNNKQDAHAVYLQDSIVRLNEHQSTSGQFDINLMPNEETKEGVWYYTKEGFIACGGWDENVVGEDLFTIQDRRNKSMLRVGELSKSKGIQYSIDRFEETEDYRKLKDYSTKHLEKILQLEQPQMVAYMRGQSKKNGYIYKYSKKELMEI